MPPPADDGHAEDRALVEAVLARDPEAVDRFLVRVRCIPRMLTARNARMGGPLGATDLEDLAQDTLTVVWRKLSTFGGRASLETWIYRFCFLELMNRIRSTQRSVGSLDERAEEAGEDPLVRAVDREHLYRALERLGPPEAEIIRLKHLEDLTFDEIGARLGISPNTAKTWYYRGLPRLRDLLEPPGEGRELQRGAP